ncbi:haloacid dehalogenase-like hydrolase family protein [Brugia malayi]|uniref:Bm8641 n=1 Tax=Brugia malayi TaxID=6279 RepID=A0A0K0JWI7_BRUMA|nr:haloacid dehalogenase-like hydrolase family protein [Brugia malayi]CDQ04708.1 Bm8641 [Brugia malayi]VIO90506.1 haloacid dehalogenase-like hydrolase family protein [Brugia malayi]
MNSTCVKVTHVIFDLDGLLLDSETVYTRINEEILLGYGKKYTMDLKAKTAGMGMNESINVILKHEDLIGKVTLEQYRKQYLELASKYLPDSKLLPGALRLVKHLAKHLIPIALCTGSNTFEFETKMQKQQELLQLINLRVLADDPSLKRCKPAPDAFLITMQRFVKKPASAANVLVFEDSINGVRAAIAAGMQVIMVPDSRYSKPPDDCKKMIRFVLKNLNEFQPETVGLPPFD